MNIHGLATCGQGHEHLDLGLGVEVGIGKLLAL
jgi:hypothetical protein